MTLLRPGQNLLDWLQTTGLSVLMTVLGAMILARLVSWGGNKVTDQIDSNYQLGDALVRSEATKHRHSVAQVITWVVITFIYVIATLKVLDQLNLPIAVSSRRRPFSVRRSVSVHSASCRTFLPVSSSSPNASTASVTPSGLRSPAPPTTPKVSSRT